MEKGFSSIYLLVIGAVLILSGFYAGMKYTENKTTSTAISGTTQIKPTTIQNTQPKENLISRCGDIPDKAYPYYQHFDVRKGPEWSPDCRHIAWSMWESGTGY